jgi:rod shape determining protein RodA
MFIIFGIGVSNLYSATAQIESEAYFWRVQIYRGIFGLFVATIIFFIHYRVLERFAYLAYGFNILLLIAVLVFGRAILGAKRWLDLGPVSIQPSEFMKITIAWTLAKYFHDDQRRPSYDLKSLFVPILLVIVPVLLIMAQPDLGTAIIILAISGCMFLFVKINTKLLIGVGVGALILLPVFYEFGLKDYQRQRIHTFIDPQADPRGAGYNSIQSMIAVGSGKMLGKGYNKGTQSQLRFLPEHHTDFIFSVYAEEHGFLGAIVLIGLYIAFLSQALKIAYGSNDKFGMLFSFGICTLFFFHFFINIGMTAGIMPVVGIPLPFMSYGGSFLLSCMAAVGLLANIANRKSMF